MQAGGLTVFFLTVWITLSGAMSARAASDQHDPLEILLSEIPPLVMQVDGKPAGVLYELSIEIIRRFNTSSAEKISPSPGIQPWPRAYRMLKMGTGKIMLQMARTPAREKMFSWVRPVMPLKYSFVNMGNKPVLSLDGVKKQGLVGVYRKSHLETFLRTNGFESKDLVLGVNSKQNYKLLRYGRVGTWLALEDEAYWLARQDATNPKITVSPPILEAKIWMATSNDVPEDVRDLLKTTLENIVEDGLFQNFCKKYWLKPEK